MHIANRQQIVRRLRCGMRLLAGPGLLLSLLSVGPGCRDARISQEMRELTGAPARIVWARQQEGAKDFFVTKPQFQLMGFDTQDRIGERVILPETGNYHKPLFTSQGDRIVFTDVPSETIFVVNWDGTGLRELSSGLADEVWLDPQTGIEWVYRIPMTITVRKPVQSLIRFQLDNPAMRETVLSDVSLNADNLQLSGDGAFMGVQYPWPKIGMLDVQSGKIVRVGKGCWPGMAPDDSRLMWVFDGPHRNLIFHSLDGAGRWAVNINGAPGIDGHEVYHPRWSNRNRFLCMTGPYPKGVFHGTEEVCVYAGRLNEKLTEVESWVQVSDDRAADFYPDFWIQPGAGLYGSLDQRHVGEVDAPGTEELVVTARLVEMTSIPTLADIAPYTQTLVVYRYEVVEVLSGTYSHPQLLAARWGIVNSRRVSFQMKVGDTVELELEPYASRDELEGERLVMELSDMRYPLFYDLSGK